MSKRVQPAVVGTFVVVGVASIIGLALLFGSGALSRNTVTLVSFFDDDLSGLRSAAPVTFRGVTVGSVESILLTLPDDPRTTTDVRAAVIYNLDLQQISAVSPGQRQNLSDPAQLDLVIQAGLRAGIKTNNLLSGIKSLALDLRPDAPDTRLQGMDLPYPEVPSLPSPFAAFQARFEEMATRIAELPLDSMMHNVNGLITDLREVVNSEEVSELADRMDATLATFSDAAAGIANLAEGLSENTDQVTAELSETFVDARAVLESMDSSLSQIRTQTGADSPLSFRLLGLLEEMEKTARAMREFIEYLESNPSAVLKGRGGGE